MPVHLYSPDVKQYTASYTRDSGGLLPAEGRVEFWAHDNTLLSDSILVVYPGLAEAPSTIRKFVEEFPSLPLVGVNVTIPDATPEGVEATIRHGTAAVHEAVKKLSHRGQDLRLYLGGQSLGALIALKDADNSPETCDGLVLVAPYGLDNEPMPDVDSEKWATEVVERRHVLMADINRNKKRLRHSEEPEEKMCTPPLDAPRITRQALTKSLEWVVMQNGAAMLETWLRQKQAPRPTVVAPATEDIVIPLTSLEQRIGHLIGMHGYMFKPVPGKHLPWATSGGRNQFVLAAEALLAMARPQFDSKVGV